MSKDNQTYIALLISTKKSGTPNHEANFCPSKHFRSFWVAPTQNGVDLVPLLGYPTRPLWWSRTHVPSCHQGGSTDQPWLGWSTAVSSLTIFYKIWICLGGHGHLIFWKIMDVCLESRISVNMMVQLQLICQYLSSSSLRTLLRMKLSLTIIWQIWLSTKSCWRNMGSNQKTNMKFIWNIVCYTVNFNVSTNKAVKINIKLFKPTSVRMGTPTIRCGASPLSCASQKSRA